VISRIFAFGVVLMTVIASAAAAESSRRRVMWYRQPATDWQTEALPLGNGRIGAMAFGGVEKERLLLNEDSIWAGGPRDRVNPKALKALPKVQKLFFENKNRHGEALAAQTMLGAPGKIDSYQPLGWLQLDFGSLGKPTDYRRELDLETGIASTTFKIGDITHTREVFVSAPDQVAVVRITADKPNAVSVAATMNRPADAKTTSLGNDGIVLSGACDGGKGIAFRGHLRAVAEGGTVSSNDGTLAVKNADAVTLLLAAATSFRHTDPDAVCTRHLAAAAKKSAAKLRAAHVADHAALFNRVTLRLGPTSDKPTGLRGWQYKRGAKDPDLVALVFQLGRYMLMASSRPGDLPANLQGIWNPHLKAPWNSDYHLNINLQMNYWPAEVCNLSETHRPVVDLLDILAGGGSDTAKRMYGCRGWVAHHLTDIFGFSVPADGIWGLSPTGGAWLTEHVWMHYDFTRDDAFLRERGWPLMKGAARFLLDFMVEAPKGTACPGKLVTCPSHSPENTFRLWDRGPGSMTTYAPTIDVAVVRDLFTHCISAIDDLDPDGATEGAFRKELVAARKKLPPLQISARTGGIQEWIKDYPEVNPRHRHISHVYPLMPGVWVTRESTPKLAAAMRKTLLRRGPGRSGWANAWRSAAWARLGDGEQAHAHLVRVLRGHSFPNLWTTHDTRHRAFQIDASFGMTAAIAEMLVQSHAGQIELLPALPKAWPAGAVAGLRARGGFEVDIEWRHGRLLKAAVRAPLGGTCRVRCRTPFEVVGVEVKRLGHQTVEFETEEGGRYSVVPKG
jgi:alpha-L-fucosidase 2